MVKNAALLDRRARSGTASLEEIGDETHTLRGVRGIVLAGTHAWGNCALERIISRPLLPVAGRPLVSYVLDRLRLAGVSGAAICANSDTAMFRRYIGASGVSTMSLDYYEDPMPRGPAGCVRDAALLSNSQTFLVVEASMVTQVDVRALLKAHGESGAALTVVVSGCVGGNGAGGPVLEPVGMYVVSQAALELVPAKGYQDIKEMLVERLYECGRRVVPYVVSEETNRRVTGASSYLAVSGWVVGEITRAPVMGDEYIRVGAACVHKSARLAPTSRLVGPVLIGSECSIEDGVTIVGPTVIGAGCRIGRRAVISRTSAWGGSRIGAGAVIDHCILADGSNVEPELAMRDAVWVSADRAHAGLSDGGSLYWRLTPRKTESRENFGGEGRARDTACP